MRLRKARSTGSIFAVALAAATLALVGAPTLSAAKKAVKVVAPQISKVETSGTKVTVSGRVTLPENTPSERRRTRVQLTLSNGGSAIGRRTVKISAKRAFKASWSTKLSGSLTLTVRVTIKGKDAGKAVKRTLVITTSPGTNPNPSQQLIGTFDLQPGTAPVGDAPTGSYFQMLLPGGAVFGNLDSPAANKNYTTLTPGTDGGLSTVAYQPPPTPAFSGGTSGSALASAIVKPVSFEGVNFGIVTASTDPQLGEHDPLPSISAQGDTLTGQVTAWSAQWNGSSFNQGTPKPNGSVPSPTTTLTGTYDPATHAFTLEWESLIVGGSFNGFSGRWHLAGTFVPAS